MSKSIVRLLIGIAALAMLLAGCSDEPSPSPAEASIATIEAVIAKSLPMEEPGVATPKAAGNEGGGAEGTVPAGVEPSSIDSATGLRWSPCTTPQGDRTGCVAGVG